MTDDYLTPKSENGPVCRATLHLSKRLTELEKLFLALRQDNSRLLTPDTPRAPGLLTRGPHPFARGSHSTGPSRSTGSYVFIASTCARAYATRPRASSYRVR